LHVINTIAIYRAHACSERDARRAEQGDDAPVMPQHLPLSPPVPANFRPVFFLLSAAGFSDIITSNQ
jgi:hypothetical protein